MFKKIRDLKKKGFCEEDLYSIRDWFLRVVPNMLDEFAEKTTSYPYEFTTIENWKVALKEMAFHIREADEPTKEVNEYVKQAFPEYYGLEQKNTPEEKDEIIHKWFEREKEIAKYKETELKKGLKMFTKHFWNLWW